MARQYKLVMKRVEDFLDVEYKNYICKNGAGDKPDNTFSTKDMKTFMFAKRVRKAAIHKSCDSSCKRPPSPSSYKRPPSSCKRPPSPLSCKRPPSSCK
ncbi:hypothetical protein HanIR_Chr09g0449451 [Helianthus annuus]|nr:hypothetical protein HanIR_Chr09g0449451 [Helianthus annuus]